MPHRFHHAVTMTSSVQVVRDGAVTVVTIDRPERRNAVDPATASALLDAFTAFDADDSSSVAVLTGSGGTFCAGADLKALAGGARHRVAPDGPGPMGPTRLELSKPVLAAVEGYAVAGGLELAIWCDLRVAAAGAAFGVFCRRFGVPLIDGGTVRLPRMIGQGRALDLILTGREVGAEEALAMGLVDRVVPRRDRPRPRRRPRTRAGRTPPDLPPQRPAVGPGPVGPDPVRRPGGRNRAGARQPGVTRCRLGSGRFRRRRRAERVGRPPPSVLSSGSDRCRTWPPSISTAP